MHLKTILISGGCGFLGQHLIPELAKEFPDTKIRVMDLKPSAAKISDISLLKNVELHLGKDICDYNSIKDQFDDVDVVIHLAGIVSFSLQDKSLLEKVNVKGTRNMLRLASEKKTKLFVHISSVAALGYGDKKDSTIDEEFNFDWSIAESRKKYYMLTKHLADIEVKKYRKNGLDSVILYPGLMFGPGDLANSARLIAAIRAGRIPFNMPGGTNIVDVRDAAKGIICCLKKGLSCGDYILSGENLTFNEINRTIAKTVSARPPRLTLPRIMNTPLYFILYIVELIKKDIELTSDNVDSAFKFRYFSNAKARKELGWRPERKFKDTISDTVRWLEENGTQ